MEIIRFFVKVRLQTNDSTVSVSQLKYKPLVMWWTRYASETTNGCHDADWRVATCKASVQKVDMFRWYVNFGPV